jgi:adenylate cyclase
MNGKTGVASLIAKVVSIGEDPRDTAEVRLKKRILVPSMSLIMLATAAWGGTYLFFGEILSGLISLVYSVITLASLLWIHHTRRIQAVLLSQLLMGLFAPFLHTLLLGGFSESSAVFLWSLMSPLAAIVFFKGRQVLLWWGAYLGLLLVAGLMQPYIQTSNQLPQLLKFALFVMNIGVVSSIVVLMLRYFIRKRDEAYQLVAVEQQKSERLLLNILPREIATELKNEHHTIAKQYDSASILFADLVGFTTLTASLAPVEMVNLLNQIFSHFDTLVEIYDVEKIRTIGDNYMVAAGVPRPCEDHAHRLAHIALGMQAYTSSLEHINGKPIHFRIGINSGPVIGGVIGRRKFVYDIWGDAVNIASRMESQGVPGKIQITQATYELVKDAFVCERHGSIQVKGRGEMETYYLVRERLAAQSN